MQTGSIAQLNVLSHISQFDANLIMEWNWYFPLNKTGTNSSFSNIHAIRVVSIPNKTSQSIGIY